MDMFRSRLLAKGYFREPHYRRFVTTGQQFCCYPVKLETKFPEIG
jgi:hypothetical protein